LGRQPSIKKIAAVQHFFHQVAGNVIILIGGFEAYARIARLNLVQLFGQRDFFLENFRQR
jgi:hypothetical protein